MKESMSTGTRLGCILYLCCLTSFAFAGSNSAKLSCRSASGRTVFTASLQDIVSTFLGASLTIDGSTLEFPEEDGSECANAVWDPENGVFTLTFSRSTLDGLVWFHFWAIPNTFKIISVERGSAQGAIYEFEGIIEAKEPRPGKSLITPNIRLTCRLEYRI